MSISNNVYTNISDICQISEIILHLLTWSFLHTFILNEAIL